MVSLSGETLVGDISLKGYLGLDKSAYWWVNPPSSWGDPYIQETDAIKKRGELQASLPIPWEQTLTCGVELRETSSEANKNELSNWKDKNSTTGVLVEKTKWKTATQGMFVQDELKITDLLN